MSFISAVYGLHTTVTQPIIVLVLASTAHHIRHRHITSAD